MSTYIGLVRVMTTTSNIFASRTHCPEFEGYCSYDSTTPPQKHKVISWGRCSGLFCSFQVCLPHVSKSPAGPEVHECLRFVARLPSSKLKGFATSGCFCQCIRFCSDQPASGISKAKVPVNLSPCQCLRHTSLHCPSHIGYRRLILRCRSCARWKS